MGRLAGQVIGAGRILGLSRRKGLSACIRYELTEREGIPTLLCARLLDAAGDPLAEASVTIVPALAKARARRTVIRLPMRAVMGHNVWGTMLEAGQAVALRWRIELRDLSGAVLARKTYFSRYSAPF